MCLGVPARIIAIADAERMLATADIMGVRREVNIACVADPDAALSDCIGEWVLVHVGFAVSRIDEGEAHATLDLLRRVGEAEAEIEHLKASIPT
ncbi:HypC/HybG/HupF family hydrogenase formation chaperone [Azospirillum halopraeferens]|uniref:HypC/HybG/HupF family hydrogenase formation chaperone n=1 Tax=Azospirillum halopraeferens TaxID=34010 RepID=UPI000413D802|nr:HypC/HybG/HupF family hydrogenase formation chaperone [Azospirillum halopraeferens]